MTNSDQTSPSTNFISGRRAVVEALKGNRLIEKILFLYGTAGSSLVQIRHLARERGVLCVEVRKEKMFELAGDMKTQGVIAIVGTKAYVDVDDILEIARERGEQAFLLVLDEIEDPQNLGALLRTSECAGVHGVIIPKHHASGVTSAVSRASAGASEYVPVAKVTNLASCLDDLKEQGVWIVGTASDTDRSYTELDASMPLAIVIGSEGKGMRKLVREKCDFLVKIPLYGKIESLNASVAGALLMYEVMRKRRKLT